MSMRRRIATAGVAGILGVTGLAVVVAPLASAETTTEEGTATVGSRLQAIKDALAGLVSDGSLTQEQADEVATTLDGSEALRGGGHGHGGGRGLSLDAAAEALGMTADELRTALGVDGTTLADVAGAQGVGTQTLVDALVAAGTERINEGVTEGRLTQEEADARIAELPERIAAMIEREPRSGGRGHGHGPRGGDAPEDGTADDSTADDSNADDAATADSAAFSATTV